MTIKDYFDEKEKENSQYTWMPVFIALMMVLLTLFIFLSTFTESDKEKVKIFKAQYKKSTMMRGKGGMGAETVVDAGIPDDPLQALINRMKSGKITKKLMDDFLTLNQIKELQVKDGKRGVCLILPDVVGFEPGNNRLTDKAQKYLFDISYLVAALPYTVEIKGYSSEKIPPGYIDTLEFSARRSFMVYEYFLSQNVNPIKLKVSGCGDIVSPDSGNKTPMDKVEIIFKSPEL